MTSRKIIVCLILLAFLLTPIFGVQEWLEVLSALHRPLHADMQIYIKAIKDVLLALVFLLFFLDVLRGRPFLCNAFVLLMLSLIIASFLSTFLAGAALMALIGLRSFSPLLLVFVAYSYLDMSFIRQAAKVLLWVFVLECGAAVVQLFWGLPLEGTTYFGMAARPFGTFTKPLSLAVFACCVVCVRLGYDISTRGKVARGTRGLVALAGLLVLLTGSGSGLLAFTVIMLTYLVILSKLHPYGKAAFVPLLALAPMVVLMLLPVLTGRRDSIFLSMSTRVEIFRNVLASLEPMDIVIGKAMGLASNAAITFQKLSGGTFGGASDLFIADSLYTSVAAQTGLLFLAVFILFNIALFMRLLPYRRLGINSLAIMMIPLALVASLGNNILELFPVNWLLCLVYGLALKGPCLPEGRAHP